MGLSLESFLALPLIKEKNIQDKASRQFSTNESDLWKTTVDSQVKEYYRVYSADVVVFEFLAPMGIPDRLEKDNYDVTTTFYKGRLVKIYVNRAAGGEFEEILTAKYGKPIKKDKTNRVICLGGYLGRTEEPGGQEFNYWGKGKKITATLLHTFYACDETISSYSVEEDAIVKLMDRIDENKRKALAAEEKKVKASASKL